MSYVNIIDRHLKGVNKIDKRSEAQDALKKNGFLYAVLGNKL